MITDITTSIKYIGVDDTDIDLFESQYVVPNGVSYNSYLILDEKIAIMDTVDNRKTTEWLENLQEALAGKTPDYLVVQHMEPDHAANIANIAERYPELKIVVSNKAAQMLPQFFESTDFSSRTVIVKEGETLSLGQHTLQFFMAPMVHWPEVMVTYDQLDKVLFSADGFGKFGALAHEEEWKDEARRYYINICGKYGAQVQALLKKAATLDINYICPLHGPVLKDNLSYYIGLYNTWSSYEPEEKTSPGELSPLGYGIHYPTPGADGPKGLAAGEGRVLLLDLPAGKTGRAPLRHYLLPRLPVPGNLRRTGGGPGHLL